MFVALYNTELKMNRTIYQIIVGAVKLLAIQQRWVIHIGGSEEEETQVEGAMGVANIDMQAKIAKVVWIMSLRLRNIVFTYIT
jgi:hypothetical protein